jgi:hypothetical protein
MSALESLRHAIESEARERAKVFGAVPTAIALIHAAVDLLENADSDDLESTTADLIDLLDELSNNFYESEYDGSPAAELPLNPEDLIV